MKILSNGGGVQTFAIQCLVAQGEIEKPDLVLFADTGGESSQTYLHIKNVQKPLLAQLDIPFISIKRSPDELFWHSYNLGVTPRPPLCSWMFKRDPINRYLKRLGHAQVMIGISLDEESRGYKKSAVSWVENIYPLLELELTRDDCIDAIGRQNLPVPPKSGCWFCPYLRTSQWYDLKRDFPDKFNLALKMEADTGHTLRKNQQPLISISSQGKLFEYSDMECSTGICGV